MQPIWELHILFCTNERAEGESRPSCGRSVEVMELVAHLKERIKKEGHHLQIRAQKAGCFELCEFGPAVAVYPVGAFYRVVDLAAADRLFDALTGATLNAIDDLLIQPEHVPHVRRRERLS